MPEKFKFNHQEYRNQLAKDIKGIGDASERREALESEQESWRYQQAKEKHHGDRLAHMERRAISKAETEEKHKQWVAKIEALKELNRRPETIRDKEAVHEAIEKYFADAERDALNLKELTASLSEKDSKQFFSIINSLEEVHAGVDSVSRFKCCFSDDLWDGRLSLRLRNQPLLGESPYMDLNDLQAFLGQTMHSNARAKELTFFGSADENTQKKINAVLLRSLLDTVGAMTYKSIIPGSEAGEQSPGIFSGGREELSRFQEISNDLGEELSLGAPEVLRELSMRIARSLPERGMGMLQERFNQVRKGLLVDSYQSYLEKLDLEPPD